MFQWRKHGGSEVRMFEPSPLPNWFFFPISLPVHIIKNVKTIKIQNGYTIIICPDHKYLCSWFSTIEFKSVHRGDGR